MTKGERKKVAGDYMQNLSNFTSVDKARSKARSTFNAAMEKMTLAERKMQGATGTSGYTKARRAFEAARSDAQSAERAYDAAQTAYRAAYDAAFRR